MANLVGTKWGDPTVGTAGGTVTWSIVGAGEDISRFGVSTQTSVSGDSFLYVDYEQTITNMFAEWSKHGNIEFEQVEDGGGAAGANADADIRIFFGAIPGATVGYAFYPSAFGSAIGGDILIDTLAKFNTNTALFEGLLLHEIGHALGLGHVSGDSVLNPRVGRDGLRPVDIEGIIELYGPQDDVPDDETDDTGGNDGGAGDDGQVPDGTGGDDHDDHDHDDDHADDHGDDQDDGNDDGHDHGDDHDHDDGDHDHGDHDHDENEHDPDADYMGEGEDDADNYGSDAVLGNVADNKLFGTDAADEMAGLEGQDKIQGYAGDDALYGGSGNDRLYGGADDDVLVGGSGDDFLLGGRGADTFVFENDHGDDLVRVFEAHVDVIDLSGVDGFDSFADVQDVTTQVGRDVMIETGDDSSILIRRIDVDALGEDNFLF